MPDVEPIDDQPAVDADESLPTFGYRAVLASAAVGFGIGILVTLAFSPLIHVLSPAKDKSKTPAPTPVALTQSEVLTHTKQLADAALGLSILGKHRLGKIVIQPDYGQGPPFGSVPPAYDAKIVFGVNANPVGTRFQIGAAQSDCIAVLKALYEHDLPFNIIRLVGTFQFPNRSLPSTVMRCGSNPLIETRLAPWKALSPGDTKRVWEQLMPHMMSRRFEQYRPKA